MNKIYAYVGNGKLGSLLGKRPNFAFLDCDITDPTSIEMALKLFRIKWGEPDLIVNCAGLTSVDRCEKDVTTAYQKNVKGLVHLHEVFGERVLSISTDQVFSGKYILIPNENTKPNPVNYYGWTKFASEQISEICNGKILRLSRTISAFDRDFIDYMFDLTSKLQIHVPYFFWRNYLTRSQSVDGIEYFATHYDSMPKVVNYGGEQNISMFTLFQELAKKFYLPVENVLPRTQDLEIETPRPHWGGFRIKLAKKLGFPMYALSDVCDGVSQELNW